MRRLLLLSIFLCQGLLLAAPAEAAERIALVFGNGDYQSAPRLLNPVNDATDVASAFERLGFSVQLIKNGTLDTMRRSLLDFAAQTPNVEIAVVYFAGQCMEIGDEDWLVPVDAKLRMELPAGQDAVSLESILPIVSRARKLGLIILDAGRDNPLSRRMKIMRALSTRGVVSPEPPDRVLIAFAASHGARAEDGPGRNSPFTTALLHNLETPGLEISDLFRAVRDEVLVATQGRQESYVYRTLSKEPVYLKEGPKPAAVSPAAEAEQAWDAVKDSTDPDALRQFVERYGATFFGDLARLRLARLRGTATQP